MIRLLARTARFPPLLRVSQAPAIAAAKPASHLQLSTSSPRSTHSHAHSPQSGVADVLKNISDSPANPSTPSPTIFDEFSIANRVAVVSGGNRGLGLEMSLALAELGARVYVVDLPKTPSADFTAVAQHVAAMGANRTLEYISADVTRQNEVWTRVEEVADKEGRMDVCVAAAGILGGQNCLEYDPKEFSKIMEVNCNGVFYTAQAAGRQMVRFGEGGSIILIASMSGSITNRDHNWVGYNTSKSAVIQMARSMACELGPQRIRVNSLSPGHIYTKMTAALLDHQPDLGEKWANSNPLGRLGRPEELRGVVAWLASDASTFCTGSDILVSGGHHAW